MIRDFAGRVAVALVALVVLLTLNAEMEAHDEQVLALEQMK